MEVSKVLSNSVRIISYLKLKHYQNKPEVLKVFKALNGKTPTMKLNVVYKGVYTPEDRIVGDMRSIGLSYVRKVPLNTELTVSEFNTVFTLSDATSYVIPFSIVKEREAFVNAMHEMIISQKLFEKYRDALILHEILHVILRHNTLYLEIRDIVLPEHIRDMYSSLLKRYNTSYNYYFDYLVNYIVNTYTGGIDSFNLHQTIVNSILAFIQTELSVTRGADEVNVFVSPIAYEITGENEEAYKVFRNNFSNVVSSSTTLSGLSNVLFSSFIEIPYTENTMSVSKVREMMKKFYNFVVKSADKYDGSNRYYSEYDSITEFLIHSAMYNIDKLSKEISIGDYIYRITEIMRSSDIDHKYIDYIMNHENDEVKDLILKEVRRISVFSYMLCLFSGACL